MRIAVIQFPGTNCEHETLVAVRDAGMDGEIFRWNRPEQELSEFDGYIVPGGFSYQDRLRAGVIASKEPVMATLKEEAAEGKPVIGICNGFQILVESGMLPGSGEIDLALAQNVMVKGGRIVRRGYYCGWTTLRHESLPRRSCGSFLLDGGALLQMPIAHAEGNLVTAKEGLIQELADEDQVIFRYCNSSGTAVDEFPVNVNGSTENIAGICNPEGNVLGMMPHPERAIFSWQLPPPGRRPPGPGPGRMVFESMRRFIEVSR
ncbi:MAG: phosphoribosylformylglycinamidine synthase I [Methanotrichaceae archaeon]|nr:phosphoribosylformylglycinamidine synthase I [Methanotrichaceae archaeon]